MAIHSISIGERCNRSPVGFFCFASSNPQFLILTHLFRLASRRLYAIQLSYLPKTVTTCSRSNRYISTPPRQLDRYDSGETSYRSLISVVSVGKSNTLSQYLHRTGLVYRPPPDMTKMDERLVLQYYGCLTQTQRQFNKCKPRQKHVGKAGVLIDRMNIQGRQCSL